MNSHFFEKINSTLQDTFFQQKYILEKHYFVRNRVLSFSCLTSMLLKRVVKNISIELSNFLLAIQNSLSCSKQAFSQVRQKFSHTAFVALNQLYVSDLVKNHFGSWKNQTMPMARVSLLFDVLNNVILNSKFSPLEESENDLFRQQYTEYKNLPISKKAIFLMDRGYPSYNLYAHIDTQSDKFVLRCKADFNKNVKKFATSDREEDSIFLTSTLWYTRKFDIVKKKAP